jgi:hypothetical protein
LLAVKVHPANIQDRDSGFDVTTLAKERHPTLAHLFADSGYEGECARTITSELEVKVEIIRRADARAHGVWQGPGVPTYEPPRAFEVAHKRWVVERTHAWADRNRRLAKEQDLRLDVAEAWIWLAQTRLLLRRLADPSRPGGR